MMRRGLLCLLFMAWAAASQAETIAGSSLVMRSSGTGVLTSTGFVGTYITVPNSGDGGSAVDFAVNVSRGASGAGADPHMNIVVADHKHGFTVSNTSATDYGTSFWLPAGTYAVRAERDYSGVPSSYSATVNSLTVNGATVSNATTAAVQDANALATANTYIENFRKGNATVALPGITPGTPVSVELSRHAFNFGTAVPGYVSTNVSEYLGNNGTAKQQNYQAKLLQNFNAIVPENAGKWQYQGTGNPPSMAGVDTFLNFAEANDLRARMHTLIWGNQQPPEMTIYSQLAIDDPGPEDDAQAAQYSALVRDLISARIDYYVGTGQPTDRALKYVEMDLYNESFHTGVEGAATTYWNRMGAEEIAEIYKEAADAAAASGATAKMFVNEYNVYSFTDYAQWYVQHIDALRNAGFAAGHGDVVQGIGTQYHTGFNVAPRFFQRILQNLGAEGLPLSLTEFSVSEGASQAQAANILENALRMMFGSPDATGFFMWGFQDEGTDNLFGPAAAMYTLNTSDWNTWTITEAGRRWQDLLGIQDWDGNPNDGWDTNLTAFVNANGEIEFNGFYGDYTFTINGQTYNLTLNKGQTEYVLTVPEPAAIVLAALAIPAIVMRRWRAA